MPYNLMDEFTPAERKIIRSLGRKMSQRGIWNLGCTRYECKNCSHIICDSHKPPFCKCCGKSLAKCRPKYNFNDIAMDLLELYDMCKSIKDERNE